MSDVDCPIGMLAGSMIVELVAMCRYRASSVFKWWQWENLHQRPVEIIERGEWTWWCCCTRPRFTAEIDYIMPIMWSVQDCGLMEYTKQQNENGTTW